MVDGEERVLIYSQIDGEAMAINSFPALHENRIVQMNVITVEGEDYSITASDFENMDLEVQILLQDNVTGNMIDLRHNDYSFVGSDDDSERFIIHILKSGTISTEEILEQLNIYAYQNSVFVQNVHSGSVEIYNILGKLIKQQKMTSDFNNIEVNTSPGYYFVKVITNGQVYSEKVYIK